VGKWNISVPTGRERKEREKAERAERGRLEKERLEKEELLEKERMEKEQSEKNKRQEIERLMMIELKMQKEKERLEKELKEKEIEKERLKLLKILESQKEKVLSEKSDDFNQEISKVINESMENAKDEILKSTIQKTSKLFDKIKSSTVSMNNSNIVHSAVRCDGCDIEPIRGTRFKCTVCENFDYCETCEDKYTESHKHPFLKIRKPENAPLQITCILKDPVEEVEYKRVVDNMDNLKIENIFSGDVKINDIKEEIKEQEKKEEEKPKEEMPKEEKPKEEGFFERVKNSISDNLKEIPKAMTFVEDLIFKKKDPKEEERKKYKQSVPIVKEQFDLNGISDEQILDALVESKGNIEECVLYIFKD